MTATSTGRDTDRDTDEDATIDPDDSPAAPSEDLEPADRSRGALTRFGLPVLLFVLAAALAITGTLLLVRADALRDDAPSSNRAVIDKKATATVIGQVSTALNSVLSYDYSKPQVAQAAAKRWLTGDAPAQYQVLFDKLDQLAPGQKLTLVAKVVSAGVTALSDDSATLLVFVDQRSTRASDGQRSVAPAQVQIRAVRQGDGWLIDQLKPI